MIAKNLTSLYTQNEIRSFLYSEETKKKITKENINIFIETMIKAINDNDIKRDTIYLLLDSEAGKNMIEENTNVLINIAETTEDKTVKACIITNLSNIKVGRINLPYNTHSNVVLMFYDLSVFL